MRSKYSFYPKDKFYHRITWMVGMLLFIVFIPFMQAQDGEEKKSFKSRSSLVATQFQDGTIELKDLVRVKVEDSYQGVPNAKVTFLQVFTDGEEKEIGSAETGSDGIATLRIIRDSLVSGEDGFFQLLARFDGKDEINGSESDLRIRPASLTLETVDEDSTYLIRVQVLADSADVSVPIVEAPVVVYVKRMFRPLKVGEGTTDESGNVEIEFPLDLPGDENGNLEITAMIEESETYGSLAATTSKTWGYVVAQDVEELPRALWSPNPPLWMFITFIILMVMVWGNYVIIIFKLFRIRSNKGPAREEGA